MPRLFFFALLVGSLTGGTASVMAQSVQLAEDVPAVSSRMTEQPHHYTLYSLSEGRVVVGPLDDARADSASTAWDIGFHGTTIIVNGGTSGPGQGAAAVLQMSFDDVTTALPDSMLHTDGAHACPGRGAYAVCTGSENGWYQYMGSGEIKPMPERTLVIRLAEGGLVKLRIVRYELGEEQGARRYTFEYASLP